MSDHTAVPALLAALVLGGGTQAQSAAPTFVPSAESPIHVGPMAGRPVLADVNGDRHLDIVLACGTCCGSQPAPDSGHVMVLLGDGKGRFAPAPDYPLAIGSSARKVAVGDVDGDGRLDCVVAQHESDEVVVLLGDGRGGLAPAAGSPVKLGGKARPHTHEVALADVDGDGDLDVLATLVNDGAIAVLRNDGKGRFATAAPVTLGRHPYDALVVRDLDGDGKADLAVPNMAMNCVSAARGAGDGTFATAAGSPLLLAPRPGYLVAGDVDGDGCVDLLATHDDDGVVSILLGDGKLGWKRAPPVLLTTPVWGSVLADLDGDGDLDLAAAAPAAGVVVLLNDGKGHFGAVPGAPFAAGTNVCYVAAGDVDEDGRVDLVASGYGSGDVTVLLDRMTPKAATAAVPGTLLASVDADTALCAIAEPATAKADRRRAWCWALSAGKVDEVVGRLRTIAADASGVAPRMTVANAWTQLLDVAPGSPAMKDWATAADAALDEVLSIDETNREARWLKAKTLALWPKSFGKTDAAMKQLETLLAQCETDKAPDAEIVRARKLMGELKRR